MMGKLMAVFLLACLLCLNAGEATPSKPAPMSRTVVPPAFVRDLASFDTTGDFLSRYKGSLIVGDSASIAHNHPVIVAVLDRMKNNSKPGQRAPGDHNKIALSIEGGGMRGCVAAGASAALNFLGLNDAVDVVYGSSAGSMIAAYFISRQYSGVQIYHGKLVMEWRKFEDGGWRVADGGWRRLEEIGGGWRRLEKVV